MYSTYELVRTPKYLRLPYLTPMYINLKVRRYILDLLRTYERSRMMILPILLDSSQFCVYFGQDKVPPLENGGMHSPSPKTCFQSAINMLKTVSGECAHRSYNTHNYYKYLTQYPLSKARLTIEAG